MAVTIGVMHKVEMADCMRDFLVFFIPMHSLIGLFVKSRLPGIGTLGQGFSVFNHSDVSVTPRYFCYASSSFWASPVLSVSPV